MIVGVSYPPQQRAFHGKQTNAGHRSIQCTLLVLSCLLAMSKQDLKPTTTTLNNGGKWKKTSPSISANFGTALELINFLPDSDSCEELAYKVKKLKCRQQR